MEAHLAHAISALQVFLPAAAFAFFALLLIFLSGWSGLGMVIAEDLKATSKKYSVLAVLPALWVIEPMIGGFFERDHSKPLEEIPSWISAIGLTPLIAFFPLAFYFIWRFSGARLPVSIFVAINLPLILAATMFAFINITGDFI